MNSLRQSFRSALHVPSPVYFLLTSEPLEVSSAHQHREILLDQGVRSEGHSIAQRAETLPSSCSDTGSVSAETRAQFPQRHGLSSFRDTDSVPTETCSVPTETRARFLQRHWLSSHRDMAQFLERHRLSSRRDMDSVPTETWAQCLQGHRLSSHRDTGSVPTETQTQVCRDKGSVPTYRHRLSSWRDTDSVPYRDMDLVLE